MTKPADSRSRAERDLPAARRANAEIRAARFRELAAQAVELWAAPPLHPVQRSGSVPSKREQRTRDPNFEGLSHSSNAAITHKNTANNNEKYATHLPRK